MRTLVALVVAALALGSESWPNPPPPPLAGFSFSPLTSVQAGRDPADDLNRLLEATQPDLVRLPIYWELVQPAPTQLDFSSVDPLLAVVTSYNALNVTLDLIQRYTPIFLGLVGGGSGHPSEALRMGDVFGLDLYVDGPSVPYRGHTSIPLRSQWKEQSLTFWADRAHSQGKDIWLA